MKKIEYIENYLKEITGLIEPCDGEERGKWLVSKDEELYVGLKGLCDIEPSLIDFLAEHEITKLDSLPEWKSRSPHAVACIGFSETEQKWYGWSHRAIFGFGIGSEVKKGDCAYKPTDPKDYEDQMMEFWKDPCHLNMRIDRINDDSFTIKWTYSNDTPNQYLRNTEDGININYPEEYGRGEWRAETLDDAKQMALDFAEAVS